MAMVHVWYQKLVHVFLDTVEFIVPTPIAMALQAMFHLFVMAMVTVLHQGYVVAQLDTMELIVYIQFVMAHQATM